MSGEENVPAEALSSGITDCTKETQLEGSALGEAPAARKAPDMREREVDDAMVWALGNWIRNETLSILAEGKYSASEIAKILDEDLRTVAHHVRGLYDAGCIESAGTVKGGT